MLLYLKCVVESMLHTCMYLLVQCQTLRLQTASSTLLIFFYVKKKADSPGGPQRGAMVKKNIYYH